MGHRDPRSGLLTASKAHHCNVTTFTDIILESNERTIAMLISLVMCFMEIGLCEKYASDEFRHAWLDQESTLKAHVDGFFLRIVESDLLETLFVMCVR